MIYLTNHFIYITMNMSRKLEYNEEEVLNTSMLSTCPKDGKHLIHEIKCCFSYKNSYFTRVKSGPISKKIITIKDRIKKSFLYITISFSASFHVKVGKHSTAKFP